MGIALFYRAAPLVEARIVRDIPYRAGPGTDPVKHRLDLFLPDPSGETGWPCLVFVHGGSWNSGDRALVVGGADVYGNIGRFYAGRGVGVAVISYRLMPYAGWREQVEDVLAAHDWVRSHIAERGGDPGRVFLGGHSAGAHLATWAALEARNPPAGLVAVSGAGYDLADETTYRLGADPAFYERLFRGGDPTDAWRRRNSPVSHLGPDDPRVLVLYARGEAEKYRRQSQVFAEALAAAGTPHEGVVVPGENHLLMIPALSRPGPTSDAVIEFLTRRRG